MKREKSLWILVIIVLLFLVFWNLRLRADPLDAAGSDQGAASVGADHGPDYDAGQRSLSQTR